MNLTGRAPYQKGMKPAKSKRKPVRKVSRKRAAHSASTEGQAETAHMLEVKRMDCITCGKAGPSDAHHCRHQPPAGERHHYKKLPAAGAKSSGYDTLPLCKPCHRERHESPKAWKAKHGPDYGLLPLVRAALSEPHEIDF